MCGSSVIKGKYLVKIPKNTVYYEQVIYGYGSIIIRRANGRATPSNNGPCIRLARTPLRKTNIIIY
jgi:hypothetical protein